MQLASHAVQCTCKPCGPATASRQGVAVSCAPAARRPALGAFGAASARLAPLRAARPVVSRPASSGAASVVCSAAAAAAQPPTNTGLLDAIPVSAFEGAIATVRAIAFYLWTIALSLPLFVSMCIIYPFQLKFDHFRRRALHFVNDLWATATTLLFYPVEIRGKENLPGPNDACVYVANHQSYLDIFSLFHLRRPFKFISKTSNFLIPIIGWSMYLTGHVPLKRMDRRSQMECLQKCRELLREGAPVLFFPEGTRSVSGKMASFKKGAFTVAAKEKVPVIPVTLDGTGRLMRNKREGQLFGGKVVITVHPPLVSANADELTAKAQAAIESALAPQFHAPKNGEAEEGRAED